MFGRVIVFQELGMASLEVENTVGFDAGVAELLDRALSMLLSRVLALEDVLKIFGDHCVFSTLGEVVAEVWFGVALAGGGAR